MQTQRSSKLKRRLKKICILQQTNVEDIWIKIKSAITKIQDQDVGLVKRGRRKNG